MGEKHKLNVEILFIGIRQLTETCEWEKGETLLKKCWNAIVKIKKEKGYEGYRYHQIASAFYFNKKDWKNSMKNANTVKELAFSIYGKESVEHAEAYQEMGKIFMELKNMKDCITHLEEAYNIKKTMLERIELNPSRTGLPESDIPDLIHRIKVSIGHSLSIKALYSYRNEQYD